MDRGLAALLTSYVRLTGTQFSRNDAAGNVTSPSAAAAFASAIDDITRRAEEISNDSEITERVRETLERLQAYWLRKANLTPSLGYKTRNDGKTLGLLREPERGKWEPFTCLSSLRDVEPMVSLLLDERGLGESETDEPLQEEGAPQ